MPQLDEKLKTTLNVCKAVIKGSIGFMNTHLVKAIK